MKILLILAMLIYFAYDVISRHTYLDKYKDTPPSLSSTAYLFDSKVFRLCFTAIAFMLLPVWIHLSGNIPTFLVFISCACLAYVANTPDYLTNELSGKIHYFGSYLGSITTCIFLLCTPYWFILLILLALQFGIAYGFNINIKEKWIYIFEQALFPALFLTLCLLF